MTKPSLCLNMIVKNEADRISRCLVSVLPYVKSVVILDTGSTDATEAITEQLCKEHNVRLVYRHGNFENFSQARNDAFKIAQEFNSATPYAQFALLMDADMELVVDEGYSFKDLDANALSYDMMQKGGAVSYANRRIVNLNWGKAPYVGVTHEYIDVQSAGMISSARFIDHADGSNREGKFIRDAQLLEADLKLDPNNGRSLYYLGNTYRDWGGTDKTVLPYAADAYRKRIALGGWDEETHSAMMHLAGVEKARGDEPTFVNQMVEAYSFRPSRAEPLYDLAQHFREKGSNSAALMFAKTGLTIKRPNDQLFVNDFVYNHGLRYEYSIAGYYSPEDRARAFEITNDLALDPTCPEGFRVSARNNLYWYTRRLSDYCPSFKATQLDFTPPPGYTAMNPSVEECNGHILCNIRCVNYKIDDQGRYMIGPKECNDAPIDTINFVCKLADDMTVWKSREVVWDRPAPLFDLVTGLEDIRLWRFHGALYFTATVREQNSWGRCQMLQGKLAYDFDDDKMHVEDWHVISDGEDHQKNWMPMPSNGGTPRFIYRLNTVCSPEAPKRVATIFPSKIHTGDISGSSQLIPFKNGYMSVVHEAAYGPDGKRTYWHRFAWFEKDGALRRLSLPFVFLDKQIEFCAGLSYHPNQKDLIVSFGVRDAEAWVATIAVEEVAMMCVKFNEN